MIYVSFCCSMPNRINGLLVDFKLHPSHLPLTDGHKQLGLYGDGELPGLVAPTAMSHTSGMLSRFPCQ